MNKVKVSVLTPSYKRAAYLTRVWEGLISQSFKDFEWIVADDGSNDGTEEVIRQLAQKSDFPVVFIRADIHIGKARMDNEAVARARGMFIVWNDSDDYLLPQAIEKLIATWNSIPEVDRNDYVGITALCGTEHGQTLTPLPKDGMLDTTWNDLAEKLKITGDMLYLTKASELKNHPFPEVDLVIPEGVIWTTLGHKKIRVLSEILQVKEYRAPYAISYSGKMEYCRGRAYAMAISEKNLQIYRRSLKTRMWKLITFIRCSLHGEIRGGEAIKLWGSNSSLYQYMAMLPISYVFVLKDRLQGKVRQTHREFISASKSVVISCTRMGNEMGDSEPLN